MLKLKLENKKASLFLFLVWFGGGSSLTLAEEPFRTMPLEKWLPIQEQISLKNLLRNVSPPGTEKGVVVASPSKHNPNYWYHWVRDAALVMDLIVDQYQKTNVPEKKATFLNLIWDYVDFSKLNQQTPTLSGGPGEPKFNVDGTAFTGPWGRPQNDGPALRALTLIEFAKILIREAKPSEVNRLFGMIKYDLEFVSHHWREPCFDIWEEIKGTHFYTLLVQHQAMLDGASFIALVGDTGASNWYKKQALLMEEELEKFWESRKGYLGSTRNRVGGIDYKKSNLDSSVLLGVLHAAPSPVFSVDNPKVQATVLKTKQAFKAIYSINQSGPSGVAMGRYPEDRYDGYSSAGDGNPWILTTNAVAEYYYLLRNRYASRGEILINNVNLEFFKDLGVEPGLGVIRKTERLFSQILDRLQVEGDEYLVRVKFHVDSDGQMAEQMNRWSGFLQGARDLTWSYASFLTALEARF